MPTKTVEETVAAIMDTLQDRGCLNGIEADLIEELRGEIEDFIVDTLEG